MVKMSCSVYFYLIVAVLLQSTTRTVPQMSNSGLLPLPYTCTTTTTICKEGDSREVRAGHGTPRTQGAPGKRGIAGPPGLKGEKGDPCQCDIASRTEILGLRQKMDEALKTTSDLASLRERLQLLEDLTIKMPQNCEEYKLSNFSIPNQARIFPLKYQGDLVPVIADCSDNDGWIVFQRRQDGSIDFYRDWESYANGFGDPTGEFWLGLRSLHKLTTSKNYGLRIELRSWEDEFRYAEYRTFRVGDENSKFQLTVSGYSGNASDGMTRHHGRQFSTKDQDNDEWSSSCSVKYAGAWWYNSCYHANLNGKYYSSSSGPSGKGVSWTRWLGDNYSLKWVQMKFGPITP